MYASTWNGNWQVYRFENISFPANVHDVINLMLTPEPGEGVGPWDEGQGI